MSQTYFIGGTFIAFMPFVIIIETAHIYAPYNTTPLHLYNTMLIVYLRIQDKEETKMTKRVSFTKAFVLGNIDHILLGHIYEEASHGYALIEKIRKEHQILLGPSTVYPSLNFLEEHGLIRSHWDMGNARPKKVFQITQKGKQTVRHQQMEIQEILSKMVIAPC